MVVANPVRSGRKQPQRLSPRVVPAPTLATRGGAATLARTCAGAAVSGVDRRRDSSRPHLHRRQHASPRANRCQRACKPGSVHRHECRMGDHSSRATLARRLQQPTRATGRNHAPERERSMPPLFGLAPGGVCHAANRCRPRGALLPHPFTLTFPKERPSALCGTVPDPGEPGPAGVTRHRGFRGARTFLGTCQHVTRPPGPLTTRPLAGAPAPGQPQSSPVSRRPGAWAAAARAGLCGTRHRPRRRSARVGSGAGTP